MKANKLTYLLVFALALTFAATGCKKKPSPLTNLPGSRMGVGDDRMKGLPSTTPIDNPNDPNRQPGQKPLPDLDPANFNQDRAALAAHTVHFDFDSAVVKSGEHGNVSAVAAYLGSNTGVALLVEGHCDERGTEEYNRSLGTSRAGALRDALVAAGADGNRITTTTFGEDKPFVTGHNESTWSQNRRGEFIVLHPK